MGNKKFLQDGFRNAVLNHTGEYMWEGLALDSHRYLHNSVALNRT